MPAIKPGESENDYVARCIPYVIKHEGLDQRRAAGKCFGMFRNAKKSESIEKWKTNLKNVKKLEKNRN